MLSMYTSIYRAGLLKSQYEKEQGFTYDCVVRCRSDLFFFGECSLADYTDRLDALVGWLVQTGQVRPTRQVAEGSSSFPAQTYERRDAHGLVEEALAEAGVEGPFSDADVAAVLTSKTIDYH